MRHPLTFLLCLVLVCPMFAQEVTFRDGTPASQMGGLIIIRQGGQTTVSLGGVLFPRKVKTKTLTPDGPVVTRFTLPSVLHSPESIPFVNLAPATLHIEIPDQHGVLYIDGELVRSHGTTRQFESPGLPPGKDYPIRVRGVFAVGENLLIEDKTILLRSGADVRVSFDGTKAVSVPLRRDSTGEVAASPKLKN